MYLCNCRAITPQDVQNYVELSDEPPTNIKEFFARVSGLNHQCGKCLEDQATLTTLWEIVAQVQQEKLQQDVPATGLG